MMCKLIFTVQGDSVITCVPDADKLSDGQRKAIRQCIGILRDHFGAAPESTCPVCHQTPCNTPHLEDFEHEHELPGPRT